MKNKTLIIISSINIVLFLLLMNGLLEVGYQINKIIPCNQNPMDSFPCFGIYDIYFFITLIFSFFVNIILIILNIKNKKEHELRFWK